MIRRRLIETVNGHLKNRGMGSMETVRYLV
jgi:hypothetical protein